MKVLFDNGVPDRLSRSLKHHSVTFARTLGWDQLSNGKLLQAAEAQQFEVMVTTDKNIKNQQNLAKRRIALVVLSNQQWPLVKLKQAEIAHQGLELLRWQWKDYRDGDARARRQGPRWRDRESRGRIHADAHHGYCHQRLPHRYR